jgi:hypothetical protein
MASVPAVCFAVYVYVHIDEPVLRLFAGPGFLILMSTALAGVAVMRLRRRVLGFLDRRFFREAYDAKAILLELVEKTRGVQSVNELGHLITSEIDRALHLTESTFFTKDSSTGYLVSVDPKHRPLSVTSALAIQLAEDSGALDVHDPLHPTMHRLPLEDRQWIADGAFCLMVPLLGSDGTFIGAIALGEKKSELPFSREDRSLLGAIAASGALALENRLSHLQVNGKGDSVASVGKAGSDATAEADSELATQCPRCWRLQKPRDIACGQCGRRLVKASVPYVLQGKFRIEERVGAGAMGVVYRAVDLDLGRTVAIKTLPSMSLNYSLQLRREARVMATVQHPNLAMIHGAETWRGTPLLVFEYLDGGTLQERIRRAPMAVDEILELGLALAGVLHQIHEAGILHRDVKPSNIGYTGDGQAKLMDFGLAHIIFEAHHQSISTRALDDPLPPTEDGSGQDSESENTWTRRLVGTPVYMSPEAVRCEPPGPDFDLWSLSIVLYEALAGRNPVQGDNVRETLSYIVDRDIPDIREMRSDLTEPVAQFFHLALSRNKPRRPQDDIEMKARLERTRAEVASEKHTTRRPDYGNQIALGHGS